MAIFTPMQVPQAGAADQERPTRTHHAAAAHTRRTHRTGLVLDIALALIAVAVLIMLF